jgi:PAS domain S-box-containing protein
MSWRQVGGGGPAFTDEPIDPTTLATLLDHAYDAVAVRRFDGRILFWNRGAERTYGWSAAEAVGEVTHALLQTRFPAPLAAIEETLAREGAWEGRLLHTCRDGRVLTVDSRWALNTSQGERVVLEIGRDITARLHAEDEARARERQLRFVTDSAPVLIAHCDAEHRFKFVNKPYAARFGVEAADLIGRSIPDVLGLDAYRAIAPYLAEALAGRPVDVELPVPYETLGTQHMHFAYEPEFDEHGAVVGYVAAVVNVSDRHQAEEALREANARKDVFLATLAHELRNPLAAMGNAVQLMMVPELSAGRGEKAAAIIQRQLKQLVRLVDDLLDVSRITRGQLQLRRVRAELTEIIRTAVESAALMIGSNAQQLRVRLPPEPVLLDADPERLSQVFTNLLMNATKYTTEGGDIVVEAAATADEVVVTVSDTGIGIPTGMLEAVFGMFTQVDVARDRASGGLGIGLTLVRSLVELHGGSVTAESDGPGTGSTFRVRLPRVQPAVARSGGTVSTPAEAIVIKRVLIADDNVDAAESLQLWLEMAGHEVHTALTGPAALEVARTMHPEVALLDVGMPGMSGLEVAQKIREAPWGRDMVLIALTGWGQDEDRQRSKEAGFDHHLTKPVPPDTIEELIRKS